MLVPTPNPAQSLGPGGTLTAVVEFGATNLSADAVGATVAAPSLFVTFPAASGPTPTIYFGPHTVAATGDGWWDGSIGASSLVEGNGVAFAPGGSAVLSSQKLAMMANASYGALDLEVRWHWSMVQPDGSNATGSWTTPTPTAQWPNSLPSEFEPAPLVSLLATNGPGQTIGENFTASLGGFVSGRAFFLELEYPSTGKVVQSHGETASSGATRTSVTIAMLNFDRYLSPGIYLVHIHDGCGAMLLSLSENASYAASASIAISLSPASCGTVTVDGSAYGSGARFTIRPSSTPYAFARSGCSGYSFYSWQFTGGLYVSSSSQLLVSASGSIAVTYQ